MKKYLKVALLISILANLYLGIYGLFQFDFLKYIYKMNETFLHFTYLIFGLCGIICIQLYKKE